ncbi:MAG TPA: M48 family peptidase, partial [Gammaproteobacteria bacterium]
MKRLAVFAAAFLLLSFLLPAHAAKAPTAAPAAVTHATAADEQAPVPVPTPSPEAVRYYRSGNVLWAVSTLWGFLLPAVIFFTGFSAHMRDWSRRVGRNWFFTIVVYFVLFTLLTTLVSLPLDYYIGFVRPHEYGLSSQLM